MEYKESNYIELKEIVNADFRKEIIAFANTDGGDIYVGVSKSGEIIGIDNPESEISKIRKVDQLECIVEFVFENTGTFFGIFHITIFKK